MQTQQTLQFRSMSRRDYNKAYYQRNKQRIVQKKRTTLFSKVQSLAFNSRLFFVHLEVVFLLFLVAAMTWYLVHESASFYLDEHESVFSAYLKAGMIEGIAIFFSFSKSTGKFLNRVQRFVVVFLCGLTLLTMAGRLVKNAVQGTSQFYSVKKQIEALEKERQQKESLQQQMIQRGWIGAARRYEKGLDELRLKLLKSQQEATALASPQVVLNSLGILLLFRFLIVVANLICVHRITERLESIFLVNSEIRVIH